MIANVWPDKAMMKARRTDLSLLPMLFQSSESKCRELYPMPCGLPYMLAAGHYYGDSTGPWRSIVTESGCALWRASVWLSSWCSTVVVKVSGAWRADRDVIARVTSCVFETSQSRRFCDSLLEPAQVIAVVSAATTSNNNAAACVGELLLVRAVAELQGGQNSLSHAFLSPSRVARHIRTSLLRSPPTCNSNRERPEARQRTAAKQKISNRIVLRIFYSILYNSALIHNTSDGE